MKTVFYLLMLATLSVSCSKRNDCDCATGGKKVEFYLLKSHDVVPNSYFTIANPQIEKRAFITFEEMESYDDSTFQFTLKSSAIARIKPILEPKAFAVTVDKHIIYTGYFRQNFLSSSCDCIRIDPQGFLMNERKITVELGYASPNDLSSLDKRNEPILLATLARAGKLQ